MYNDKRTEKPQTNFRMLYNVDGVISALFLNTNNKSIRLVAEDVGVLEIFERKSAFDKYDDNEDEFEGPWSEK